MTGSDTPATVCLVSIDAGNAGDEGDAGDAGDGDSIETHRPEMPSSPVSLVIDIQEHSSEPSLVAHPQGTETQLETLNLGDRPQDLEAVSAALETNSQALESRPEELSPEPQKSDPKPDAPNTDKPIPDDPKLNEQIHHCHVCLQAFSNGPNLRRHIALVHVGSRRQCLYCDRIFSSNQKINNHIDRDHPGRPHARGKPGRPSIKK